MQFKYPELLWALLLLLIPIFIHLFQLRRFKKTPFTNVKLLQEVVAQTRRSSQLKKWLLLCSRLLLLASLVLAFMQPFLANETALTKKETIIYLDDSFSMQAKSEQNSLTSKAIQDLIKSVPKETEFTLFTNEEVFTDVSIKDIQNQLLTLKHTPRQLQIDEISLKAKSLFTRDPSVLKQLVVISDFQERIDGGITDSILGINRHLVKLLADEAVNVSIDTTFISNSSASALDLSVTIRVNRPLESTPVSLFNGNQLIAKTSAQFNSEGEATVLFSIPPGEVINGKIQISDEGLAYDNALYFNVNEKEKINVTVVGESSTQFLGRIFTDDEFNFTSFNLNTLNYSSLDSQHVLILNQIASIPNSLSTSIRSFIESGGSLVIIPHAEASTASYNSLLSNYASTSLSGIYPESAQINLISFAHPLFKGVFEKQIQNFQFPNSEMHFKINSGLPKILGFQNGDPLLVGGNNIFIFTSPLDLDSSNFQNSPLVVPTFYNIGIRSLKQAELYYHINTSDPIDVASAVEEDHILKIRKGTYEFIPQQQSFSNKTTLSFVNHPNEEGIYGVYRDTSNLKNISFNFSREESQLNYILLENLQATSQSQSIDELFDELEKVNKVNELWKWFVILALLFVLIEVLILKFIK